MASLTTGSGGGAVLSSGFLAGSSLASSRTRADSGKSARHGNLFTFVDKKVEKVRARRDNVGKTVEGLTQALFATTDHRKRSKKRFAGACLKVDVRALKEECKADMQEYFIHSKSTVKNQDRVKLIKVLSGAEDIFDRRAFTQSIRAGGAGAEEGEASSMWQGGSSPHQSRARDIISSAALGDTYRRPATSADGARDAYRYARDNVLREGGVQPPGKSWRRQSFDSVQLEGTAALYEELTPLGAAMQEGVLRDLVPVLLKHVFNSASRGSDRDIAVGDGDDDHVRIVDEEIAAVNLRGYALGDDRAACLNAALAVCPSVRRLDVSGNRLTNKGLRALLLCVQEHLNCETLLIADNCLGESSARVLAQGLQGGDCSLRELSLAKCKVGDAVCAMLAAGLAENCSLRVLNLSNNSMGALDDSGAEALARCVQQNRCLEELDLSWNNIRRGSARALCEAVGDSSRLVCVSLGNNNIGDEAAMLMARRMQSGASSLQRLDLSHNGLSYRSALVVACMLETSETATEVRFDGNNIGSLGGQQLLRAVYTSALRQRSLRVLMSDCGLRGSAPGTPALEEPQGQLLLSLDDPYERALAATYLRLANTRAAASLRDLKIRPDNTSRSATFEALILSRKSQQAPWEALLTAINTLVDGSVAAAAAAAAAGKSQKKPAAVDPSQLHEQLLQLGARMGLCFTDVYTRKLASTLRKVDTRSRNRPFKVFRLVFKTAFILADRDRARSLSAHQLAACLSLLGYRGQALGEQERIAQSLSLLRCCSPHAIECIEQSAFLQMMMWQCCCFAPAAPAPLMDPSGSVWALPPSGTLKFDFAIERSLRAIEPSSYSSFARFCDAAAGALRSDQDRSDIMHLCCSSGDLVLSCAQAEILLSSFRNTSEPLGDSVERLLPLLASPAEACALLAKTLPFKDLLLLRHRTGSYFRVVSGVGCSGHYSLDLARPKDRMAYERLLLVNECERRNALAEPRNTSQKGDFDNFRNDRVGGLYLKLGRPIEPSQSTALPPRLDFDYASTARPLQGMPPLADRAFGELLELAFRSEPSPTGTREHQEQQQTLPAIGAPIGAGSSSAPATGRESGWKLLRATANDADCLFWLNSLRSNYDRCVENQLLALLALAERLLPGRFRRVCSAEDYAAFYSELMAQQEFADLCKKPLYSYDDRPRGGAELQQLQQLNSLLAGGPNNRGHEHGHEHDVSVFMSFVHLFCSSSDDANSRAGVINVLDLDAAMKKFRHASSHEETDSRARELMGSLDELFSACGIGAMQWFRSADVLRDGRLSLDELRRAVLQLCDSAGAQRWPECDLLALLRWLDPSDDGQCTELEFKMAVRWFRSEEHQELLGKVTPVLTALDALLRDKRMRVVDIFAKMDLDRSGTVSGTEMAATIRDLLDLPQKAPVTVDTEGGSGALRGDGAEGDAPTQVEQSIAALVADCSRFTSSLARLEVLLVYGAWLSAAQAARLALLLAERSAPDEVVAHAVCIVFNRIVDLENFSAVLTAVSPEVRGLLYHRLGVSNILGFTSIDGDYELELSYSDHRTAAQVLLRLAAVEGRDCLHNAVYLSNRLQPPRAPAAKPWVVPAKWFDNERAVPKLGVLSFCYVSGDKRAIEARTELTKLHSLAGMSIA